MHWLVHFLGMDNLSGYSYGFWSGFGSDIAELAIIGAVYGALRKHNCHTPGCWRIGRHVVDGTPWCNRHHRSARTAADAAATVLRTRMERMIREGNQAIHRRLDDHADLIKAAATKGKSTDA